MSVYRSNNKQKLYSTKRPNEKSEKSNEGTAKTTHNDNKCVFFFKFFVNSNFMFFSFSWCRRMHEVVNQLVFIHFDFLCFHFLSIWTAGPARLQTNMIRNDE